MFARVTFVSADPLCEHLSQYIQNLSRLRLWLGWNEKEVRGASLIAHQRREQIKIEEWKKESTEYKKPSRQASRAAT